MNSIHNITWPRLFAESVAIVGSILLAFAIDAWWENRGDQGAKFALLQRLDADFRAIKPELLVVEEEHRLRQEAASRILETLSVGDSVRYTQQLDRDIAFTFIGSRTFQPGTGALDAFVNGDGARLIDNERLADLLLQWPGLVKELQEEEGRLLKVSTDRWTPFLSSRTSLAPFIAVMQEYNPAFGDLPDKLLKDSGRVAFEVDQEFLNLALERFAYQTLARRDVAPVIAAVEEILYEISIELARD